ncbi:MAG: hypothetical protein JWN38_949 [Candidatus Saccharibacteria bacterium]|nr:hypothetical protein [Candidatus Saccharibacteria bacterium]
MLFGAVVAVVLVALGQHELAPLVGWDVAASLFVLSVMTGVTPFTPAQTKDHALGENPGRKTGDILLLFASFASLLAVGLLVLRAGNAQGGQKLLDIALGLVSVIASWCVVHTMYMLTYARLYYGTPEGGIDFNGDKPSYSDFAYVAFTLGMTFQVSDTALQSRQVRSTVLRHTLLSYVFSTVIIASTINFVVSLSQ